ncbi:hypothetical protein VT03_03705 [Planctomyces sp. SH-PL14]|nr:hypothetical protein VT03_03705 [Planctomyces sp. SH-PL14]
MSYELLQACAIGEGVPMDELSVSAASSALALGLLGLVVQERGRLMTTARGSVVCRAETEAVNGVDVRVRAGSLWVSELSEQWAALDVSRQRSWGE